MRRPIDTRENIPSQLVPRTARVRADRLLDAALIGLRRSERSDGPNDVRDAGVFRDLAKRAREALDTDADSRILIPGEAYVLVSNVPVTSIKK